MAFDADIVEKALIDVGYKCEACGKYWHEFDRNPKHAPLHGHSETTLHIVRDEKTGLYWATAVPPGHEKLLKKPIAPQAFIFQRLGRGSDIRILCHLCHQRVHDIAKAIKNGRNTTGDAKNAIPAVLEMVTVAFILNRGVWTSY